MSELKRAIVFACGGPAVGLSLGALKRLHEEPDIRFDVWFCACIRAWVGVLWNQAKPGDEFAAMDGFMRRVSGPDALYADDKPFLYHNAYNPSGQALELFSNKKNDQYQDITAASLCACSALPYIEAPVEIENSIYCEGATVYTVNFERLLQNYPDLDEVWVSRILDVKQVRRPNKLVDAPNNLVMLFASTVSEDDVNLFIEEVGRKKAEGVVKKSLRVLQLEVDHNIYYDWTYSNLDAPTKDGYRAAERLLAAYRTGLWSHSEHRAKTPRAAA